MKKIHLNLPTFIQFGNNSSIEYIYNAAGQKVKKRVYDGTVSPNTIKDVHYLDGFQYAGDVLQFFPHAEGYVNVTANEEIGGLNYLYNYVFNYTDHLGNIRMSFTKDPVNNQLKILEENHYYPFGLKHEVYADAKQMYQLVENLENTARPTFVYKTDYQYKYNGKEFQDELNLNLYDYGARNYDPALGRWMNIDPLAEQMRRHSPYNYTFNNPIRFIDPDGMAPTTDYFDSKGKFIKRVDDGKTDIKIFAENTLQFASPSELSNSKGSLKALANVTAHYASGKGFSGDVIVTTAEGSGSAFYSNGDITVRKSTFDSGVLDSYGNLNSAVNHEIDHSVKEVNSFADHAGTYMREASNSEFKDATDSYKLNNANKFINRVLNASSMFEIDDKGIQSMVSEYNKNNTGGINIHLPSITGSEGGVTPTIKLNGEVRDTNYEYKKLDDFNK